MDIIDNIKDCLATNKEISIDQEKNTVHIGTQTYPGNLETLFYHNDQPIVLSAVVAAVTFSRKFVDYRVKCTRLGIPSLEALVRTPISLYLHENKPTNLLRIPTQDQHPSQMYDTSSGINISQPIDHPSHPSLSQSTPHPATTQTAKPTTQQTTKPTSSTSQTTSTSQKSTSSKSKTPIIHFNPSGFEAIRRPYEEWTLNDIYADEMTCGTTYSSIMSSLPEAIPTLNNPDISINTFLQQAKEIDLIRFSSNLIVQSKPSSTKSTELLKNSGIILASTTTKEGSTSTQTTTTHADKKQKSSSSSAIPVSTRNPAVATANSNSTKAQRPSSSRNSPYIIIVPVGTTSLLGLPNIEEFLCHNKYKPISECDPTKLKTIPSNNQMILFQHSLDTSSTSSSSNPPVTFAVTDAPEKLTSQELERVVAIFASGQQWQLRNIKIGQNPTELFTKVPGFYVHFETDVMHDNAKKWPITKFEISRTKRHTDSSHVKTFWNIISQNINDGIRKGIY